MADQTTKVWKRTSVVEELFCLQRELEHRRIELFASQLHHLSKVIVVGGPRFAFFWVEEPAPGEELERLPSSQKRQIGWTDQHVWERTRQPIAQISILGPKYELRISSGDRSANGAKLTTVGCSPATWAGKTSFGNPIHPGKTGAPTFTKIYQSNGE